jgi:hypothetical protein
MLFLSEVVQKLKFPDNFIIACKEYLTAVDFTVKEMNFYQQLTRIKTNVLTKNRIYSCNSMALAYLRVPEAIGQALRALT